MNMQALLKQAQKMQKEIGKVEEELAEKEYESTMGGGVIKVVVKNMNVENISIDESLLDKDGKEDLEQMVTAAVNDALNKATADKEEVMNSVTGGVKMPGGF